MSSASAPLRPWTMQSRKLCGSGQNGDIPEKAADGSDNATFAPLAPTTGCSAARRPTPTIHNARSDWSKPRTCRSNDIQKSEGQPTHTIRRGKSTLKSASASKWQTTSPENESCWRSGKNITVSAPYATRQSPSERDGPTITSFGEQKVAHTAQKTEYCSTQNA